MPEIKGRELELVLQRTGGGAAVAEVLVEFAEPVSTPTGSSYLARACGAERPDGRWHGWLEFTSTGTGEVIRSGRETTQPNRQDVLYWATGLSPVYLEGSLHRALTPVARSSSEPPPPPAFDAPAPAAAPESSATPSILNPFSVYRKGEPLLRRQLGAFSRWHLVNIIRAHGLDDDGESGAFDLLDDAELIEMIVAGVRARADTAASR